MRCRYTFAVTGLLRLESAFPFASGGFEYEFQTGELGVLTAIAVTVRVPDKTQWPRFTLLSGPGAAAEFHRSCPGLTEIQEEVRVIEVLLAPHGIESIDVSYPKQDWIAESEEEQAQLQVFSTEISKDKLRPQEFEPEPFGLMILSVLAAKKASDLEVPLSFFRKGINDMHQGRYIEAIYDFYFMLETLYGKGQTKNYKVEEAFLANSELVACIQRALNNSDFSNAFRSDPALSGDFSRYYQNKTIDEVIDRIVERRGFFHHHVPRRRDIWHPEQHEPHKVDAMMLERICFEVFTIARGSTVFSPEVQAAARQIWQQHLQNQG